MRTKKHTTENTAYAAMMGRMIRAWVRRTADGDPTDLADMLAARAALDEGITAAVVAMREQSGFSWAEIAAHTGTTRQAAQQRWGKACAAAATVSA